MGLKVIEPHYRHNTSDQAESEFMGLSRREAFSLLAGHEQRGTLDAYLRANLPDFIGPDGEPLKFMLVAEVERICPEVLF